MVLKSPENMRISKNVRARIAAVASILTVLTVAGSVHAQFSPPTCVPPNCNPEVIQNIAITGTAQTASINISGSGKMGGTFQNGALAPVLTLATENLYYGNVGGTSVNASLMLLQFGSADRLRVTLAGQMQLPLGAVGAPSYSFIGDTNTGMYSTGADSIGMTTNGVIRTTTNNSGMTLNSGVLALPAGTNAAPSLTFTGDLNTGIFHPTADTMSFVTNGQTNMTVSATNNVVITNGLTVGGTTTFSGGVSGNGSGLTNLNASNITTGTLADARLSSNVPLLNGTQTFTGANTFSNAGNSFTGNGSGLTSLNASNITSGALPDARLSSNVALYNANGTFTGNNGFTGMTSYGSAALPVIGAQNLLYGNVDTTSSGALLLLQNESVDRFRVAANGDVTATSFSGVGTNLTALNATNLTSGTVPSARISGTYSNALTFSGANSYTSRSSFGSATLVVAAGQNLLYGNVDTTSAGNLLLLQNESVDRFRVDAAGNLTLSGTITASGALTSGGVNVCLQNGTNCPPTLNGAGTADYITKFTGTGSTVGDSIMFEDTANGRIGIGTTAPGNTFEVRNGNISTYSGSIAASFGSVSAYLVAAGGAAMSGQAVGVGSIGVTGVGGSYGVYGSGDYGGYFVGNDNFGGAGIYAEWTGTGAGGGVKGYTTRPAAWAGWFEATDSTNSLTRGLYVSAPTTSGGKALYVVGDTHMTNNLNVVGNETIGGVSTEAYNVITNYAQITGQAGDAVSGAGRLSYNTTTNKFRCNEGGTWKDCVTSGVTGSGTTNYLPKFTASTTLGNSLIYDNGTNVGIGTNSPGASLQVVGSGSYGIYVSGTPSWGVYSATPIEANGTTFGVQGTATGGAAGGVHGTAQGAGIVYGVVGNTTVSTDVNSAGVYGSGQNGVFGYSNVASGVGVKAQAFTSAPTALSASVGTTSGGANTSAVLATNTSTVAVTNWGINAGATGANAGTNIGAYLNASGGASNYALITYLGSVGLGEQTPLNPVVIGSDGSAATPALAIGAGDDSNTGFFHPNADTVAISAGGTERMRVDTTGVGIGTTPSYPLDVSGRGFFDGEIAVGGDISSVWAGYGIASSGTASGGHFYNTNYPSVYGSNGYAYGTDRYGVYGSAIDSSGATKYAGYFTSGGSGTNYGVYANGSYAGVYANGSSYGLRAVGSTYGVYSTGTYAGYFGGSGGAYAYVGYNNNYGVYASAPGSGYGVYAYNGGTGYGVFGSGGYYGVYGEGAVRGGDFYDTSGTAHTFIAGASYGVEIITGNAIKPGGGSWLSSSDRRVKKDINDFKDGIDTVRALKPVNFTYNGLGGTTEGLKSIGFIAQDTEKVAPYLIKHDKRKLHPEDTEDTDLLLVDPSAIPFINMNAIKELDLKIVGMEAKITKIDEIDAKVKTLEERVERLEEELDALRQGR
jgi:hypothetical protein